MNVALYGARGPGWAMTERGRPHLARTPAQLAIGPSRMSWRDGKLIVAINEITVPWPRRLSGIITVSPGPIFDTAYDLDPDGRHQWTPLAPCARVTVAFDRPGWAWSGTGYLDSNHGDAPLATGFARWDWSRATLADGSTAVLYDATRRDSSRRALGLRFYPDGIIEQIIVPPRHDLPRNLWRMQSTAHGASPVLRRRLESAPFYTRSLVAAQMLGEDVVAVHESLSLDRYVKPWVQALLPFRMPRRR